MSCIISKYEYYTDLNNHEKKVLERLEDNKVSYNAGEIIAAKGEPFDHIYTIFDGWGFVSTNLDANTRSIFDLRMNGDFVGTSELSFKKRLYDFYALTDMTVCPFPKEHLDEMLDTSRKLRDVFFMIISREKAIANERILSIGRRSATVRIAHFLLEVSLRFGMIGGKPKEVFDFPLKQDHIADILGLSPVHVSRAMTDLKNSGYISYDRKSVTIRNGERLLKISLFDPEFIEKAKPTPNYQNESFG